MSITEFGGPSPKEMGIEPKETEAKKFVHLTRVEIESKLGAKENLENLDLSELDLAGLVLEGVSFHGSDLRGTVFFHKESEDGSDPEIKTSIKGADFTEAVFATYDRKPAFVRVEAEGAKFGYTESLLARLRRYEESGKPKTAEDSGGLFNFNGCEGNFQRTNWVNIDFGGDSGFGATFYGADFSGAVIDGCDLSGIDLSETIIDNIKIINPVISSEGFMITEEQVETIVAAISFTDNRKDIWEEAKKKNGSRELLENILGIAIVIEVE